MLEDIYMNDKEIIRFLTLNNVAVKVNGVKEYKILCLRVYWWKDHKLKILNYLKRKDERT